MGRMPNRGRAAPGPPDFVERCDGGGGGGGGRVSTVIMCHVLSGSKARGGGLGPQQAPKDWGRDGLEGGGLSNEHRLMCPGVGEGAIILRVTKLLHVARWTEIPNT